jgi:hypothetical protein
VPPGSETVRTPPLDLVSELEEEFWTFTKRERETELVGNTAEILKTEIFA